MDDLITQLDYVISMMDTIPIVHLENMEKFMDCARRVKMVSEILKSAQKPGNEQNQEAEQKPQEEKVEVKNDG